jgi:hypothetical protein
MLFDLTSPSSPFARTEKVSVVDEGAEETTAEGAETAVAEPAAFEAVTATRMVEPTSAEVSVKEVEVAAATSAQAPPEELQRRHWYVYESGCEPLQVPWLAVRV